MKQQKKSNNSRHWRLAMIGGAVAIGAFAVALSRQAPVTEQTNKPETAGAQTAAPAAAVSAPASGQAVQGAAKNPATGQSGQVIFIDPQTGLPREGTPEEYQALTGSRLNGLSSTPAEEPTPFVLPNGAVGVRVPESLHTSIVATKNPDGTVSFSETTGDGKSLPQAPRGISITKSEVPNDR